MSKSKLLQGIGHFDSQEYEQAFQVLLPLAENGSCKAQCFVALMYQFGDGVEANGQESVQWYIKAGQQKVADEKLSATAYHNLAELYKVGCVGVNIDLEKSKNYRSLAQGLGFEM